MQGVLQQLLLASRCVVLTQPYIVVDRCTRAALGVMCCVPSTGGALVLCCASAGLPLYAR